MSPTASSSAERTTDLRSACIACLVLLAGCSQATGTLATDSVLISAEWIELDIAQRSLLAIAKPDPNALNGSRWRTTHMLFHRVAAGSVSTASQAAKLPPTENNMEGEAEDRVLQTSRKDAFVAVFELTQHQWNLLYPTPASGETDGEAPATWIAATDIVADIRDIRLPRYRLDIPDAALWARACNSGVDGLYGWGDSEDPTVTTGYAVHHTLVNAPTSPQKVGTLMPNVFGLHDMHGNVWEIVRTDSGFAARGGAWNTPLTFTRSANSLAITADERSPDLGVRLALLP